MAKRPHVSEHPRIAQSRNLNLIIDLAKRAGAEVTLIRGAENAALNYELAEADLAPLELPLADSPLIVLMQFKAADGRPPGVETR